MKICTATYHRAHNYGAMLQAYALQQSLISLGYENEIIDYTEHKPRLFRKISISLKKDNLASVYYNIKILLKYKKFKSGYERFERFYRDKIIKTRPYYKYDELQDISCDLLLAGSDQIWNFKNKSGISEFYTFSFNHEIKKATYAVSMGGYSQFDDSIKKEFNSRLKEFQYISARECDVIEYINKEKINVQNRINIDPVFLLGKQEWSALADESEQSHDFGEYILCYELIPNPVMEHIANKLKEQYGYKIVIVAPTAYSKMKGDYVVNDAGPMELVKLIRDSKYVVSTSFHGIAFSIIFNKPFYAVFSAHAPGRIKNLLQIYELENKGISNIDSRLDNTYDFSRVNELIEQQRKSGIEYLSSLKSL